MHPENILFPVEITNAAKSIDLAAAKWGRVADGFSSYSLPAAFLLGVIVAVIVVQLWSKKT